MSPLRRARRAALWTFFAALVLLGVLIAQLLRMGGPTYTIREDRLMGQKEAPVHVFVMDAEAAEEMDPLRGETLSQPAADSSLLRKGADEEGAADSSLLRKGAKAETDAAESWVRYPVGLDDELQRYIEGLCAEADFPAAVVMAMIAVETGGTWDPALVGDGGSSVGLMQIYAYQHLDRMERLGVRDLTDPRQNAAVGIDLLRELSGTDRPVEWVLMAYNGGAAYADRLWEAGELSRYAQKVIALSECYLEGAQFVVG